MNYRWRSAAGAVGLRLPVPFLMWWSVWSSKSAGPWMVSVATAAMGLVLLSTLMAAKSAGQTPAHGPKYEGPRA